MTIAGELAVLVTANTDQLKKGLKGAMGMLGGLKGMLAGLGIGAGVGFGVELAAQAEQAEASFAVLLKSGEKAREMMEELRDFGTQEGILLDAGETRKAAQQLIGYGVSQGRVRKVMGQMSDAAAITGARMTDLAEIYGRVRQSNMAMNEDLERLNDRNIAITAKLAETMGMTVPEVRKLASEGKISFGEFQEAWNLAVQDFAGGAEKMSQTARGAFIRIRKAVSTSFERIGTALIENINVDSLVQAMEGFAEWTATKFVPALIKALDNVRTVTEEIIEAYRIMWDIGEVGPEKAGERSALRRLGMDDRAMQRRRDRQRGVFAQMNEQMAEERVAQGQQRQGELVGKLFQGFAKGGADAIVKASNMLGEVGDQFNQGLKAAGAVERAARIGPFESNRAVMAGTVEAARLAERDRIAGEQIKVQQEQLNAIRRGNKMWEEFLKVFRNQPGRSKTGGHDMKDTLG